MPIVDGEQFEKWFTAAVVDNTAARTELDVPGAEPDLKKWMKRAYVAGFIAGAGNVERAKP
jgi:hypothetical protein